ncbi:MAG: hypothetical protein AABY88_09905 [Pseudomonadota bacterium]
MWRATVRFSLDKDTASTTRNKVAPYLKKAGFQNTKTGTWEAFSQNSLDVTKAILDTLKEIEDSQKMDHVWIHIEKLNDIQQKRLSKAMAMFLEKI